MPLQIVRQDITKIKCDAIVNPTNVAMFAGGGVDKAIHRVAGKELDDECDAIGGCAVGDAISYCRVKKSISDDWAKRLLERKKEREKQ